MANESALALAQFYLDKHKTPDHLVGLGPVLDRGRIILRAAPNATIEGGLVALFDPETYVDCRVIAQRLYLDIANNNPELTPRIVMQDGRLQNWVEITDPKTGKTIQIDATPWYGCLNPGLVGSESSEVHIIDQIELKKNSGPILSVKRTETGVITLTLAGYLPRVSITERLQELRMLTKGMETTDGPKAEYLFIVGAVFRGDADPDSEKVTNMFIEVIDSAKLQQLLPKVRSIEELVEAGVVRIGVCISNSLRYPFRNLEMMRIFEEKMGTGELFEEIVRNMPRLFTLLQDATPKLQVHMGDACADVRSGRIEMQLRDLRRLEEETIMRKDYSTLVKYFDVLRHPILDQKTNRPPLCKIYTS